MSRLWTLSLLLPNAFGHMMLDWPMPMRSKFDPYTNQNDIDYSYTSPLKADGSNFPCKGYQTTVEPSVTSYTAGQTYNMSLTGTATHNGGTCQLSLSVDGGKTFKVIKTMIGGCPLTSAYDFTVPSYAPSGKSIFAWSWINHTGNREFYMNCAWVDLVGSQPSETQWDALPNIFVAQLQNVNECYNHPNGEAWGIPEGHDVVPPHPGSDVVYGSKSSLYYPPPTPQCEVPSSGSSANTNFVTSPSNSSSFAETYQPQPVADPNGSNHTLPASNGNITYVDVYEDGPCSSESPLTVTSTITTITVGPTSAAPTTLLTITIPASTAAVTTTTPTSSSQLPFATGDTSQYLPCVPGTFLCSSADTFLTCDSVPSSSGGYTDGWTEPRSVADGMECLPFLSPVASGMDAAGQMPGAPQGEYRDDRYVRSRPDGDCPTDGALECNGPGGFWVCDQGGWVDMGAVASGTTCMDGQIVAAS